MQHQIFKMLIGDIGPYNLSINAGILCELIHGDELMWFLIQLPPDNLQQLPSIPFASACDPLYILRVNACTFLILHSYCIHTVSIPTVYQRYLSKRE